MKTKQAERDGFRARKEGFLAILDNPFLFQIGSNHKLCQAWWKGYHKAYAQEGKK